MFFFLFSLFVVGEAHTVPVSDRFVHLEIVVPWSGEVVGVKSPDGGMVRIENLDTGEIFGITPTIGPDQSYSLALFAIETVAPRHERIRLLETMETIQNEPTESSLDKTGRSFHISILGHGQSPNKKHERWASDCCVTCGSTKVCGCAVEMSCGSCCVKPCCRND